MGLNNRLPTTEEQAQMEKLMDKAMKDGAVGLSYRINLSAWHVFERPKKLFHWLKLLHNTNGVYATHMRNEGLKVTEAIDEALTIGRQANIPVQISHFKVSGKANWGKSNITLGMVKKARKEGIEVTIDQYPYTASSTNLAVLVPDWALEGGLIPCAKEWKTRQQRKKSLRVCRSSAEEGKNKNFAYAVVAMYAPDTTLNGKNISEINQLKGRKKKLKYESETVLDMLKARQCTNGLSHHE